LTRLVGIDIPENKRIVIALTYIQGVGPVIAARILNALKVDLNLKTKDLSEQQIVQLRTALQEIEVEGDLRRRRGQNVRRLMEIGSFRGDRHKKKLPCRGQRTHTNARTKRGKKIAVAGKKKV
jgi:small subunit ribosomal protein S13